MPETRLVDLHLHSACSDGAETPTQLAARAASHDLAAIALTDHDTTAGCSEAQAACERHGLEFLAGVEISAMAFDVEVHVLGLGIDPDNATLQQALAAQIRARRERGTRILEKLREQGIALDAEEIHRAAGASSPGRMHIAKVLHEKDITASVQDGFDRFLNPGRPAFVAKEMLSVPEAIALIHGAFGLAFIAHPALSKTMRQILPQLLALPFDGIEAWHPSHSPQRIANYRALAKQRGLLVCGGSDCHGGINMPATMGKVRVPWACYQTIRNALAR
jgi:predicted metal-dependent phosphoesterase TrpH